MLIYIILLIALFLGFVVPRKSQIRYSFVIFVIMMLICGLRAESVGTDTANYYRFFLGAQTNDRYGFFYEALRDVNFYFGGNPSVALLIVAALTFIPLFIILKKHSPYLILSLVLYTVSLSQFYLETFNLARQSLAIVFVLFAVCMSIEQQPGRERFISIILCLSFAFIAHKMTVISWPFFLFSKHRFSIATVVIVIIVSIIIGLSNILENVYTFLNYLQKFEDANYLSTYADHDIESELNVIGTLTRLIPISVLCLLLYPQNKKGKTVILFNFFFGGVIIINILMRMSLCVRFASPLLIAELILVPCMYKEGRPLQKLGITLFIAYECAYYFYSLYSLLSMSDLNPPVPYKCVL